MKGLCVGLLLVGMIGLVVLNEPRVNRSISNLLARKLNRVNVNWELQRATKLQSTELDDATLALFTNNPHPKASRKQGGNQRNLVMYTYASHKAGDFCDLLKSCARAKLFLRVLGFGGDESKRNIGAKLPAMAAEMANLDDDLITLFVDAFDVIVVNSAEHLLNEFLKLDQVLVFQGEKGCWPQVTYTDGYRICTEVYPPSPTMYRYLNSGVYIGYAWAVKKLFKALEKEKIERNTNDQELVSNLYIQRLLNISLDHQCQMFQSLHNSEVDQSIYAQQDMNIHIEFNEEKGCWQNKVTGSFPSVFHFNGGGKNHYRTVFGRALGHVDISPEEGDKYITFVGSSQFKYSNVCL